MGIDAPLDHIYSSSLATALYVAKMSTNKKVNVVGELGIRTALIDQGLEITDEQSDVLVMGIDRQISYEKLVKACDYVQNGAKLIGTNGDIKFPNETAFTPGNGSFVQLVANVSGLHRFSWENHHRLCCRSLPKSTTLKRAKWSWSGTIMIPIFYAG